MFPLHALRESPARPKEAVEKLGVQYLEIATVTRSFESQQVTRLVDRPRSVLNKRAPCLPLELGHDPTKRVFGFKIDSSASC